MLKSECLRVLLVYDEMIPSVRLCGHLQLMDLAQRGIVDYKARREIELTNVDLNWADIVIIGRLDSWMADKLVQKLKRVGKYICYILDDDLLNVPQEVSSGKHYQNPDVRNRIVRMIKNSNALISPSPIIHDKYLKKHQKRILIEEPVVNPAAFAYRISKSVVKIGFAGSIDRKGDIEKILAPVYAGLKEKYSQRIQFEFFGAIPSFAEEINARSIPYCDSYDTYREMLNKLEWDIGLSPMPDTPFHACKHYNKYIEYAAAGILGVFSEVMPYIRLNEKTDGVVFCSNDSQEWIQTLSALIENDELRERLRYQAWRYATEEMSIEKSADDFMRQLSSCNISLSSHIWMVPKVYAVWSNVIRVWRVIRSYGWKAPTVVLSKVYGRIRRKMNR